MILYITWMRSKPHPKTLTLESLAFNKPNNMSMTEMDLMEADRLDNGDSKVVFYRERDMFFLAVRKRPRTSPSQMTLDIQFRDNVASDDPSRKMNAYYKLASTPEFSWAELPFPNASGERLYGIDAQYQIRDNARMMKPNEISADESEDD